MDSVSLYIHIPFCRQKCDYCDFYSVAECNRRGKINDLSDIYIDSLLKEVKSYVTVYKIKQFNTVYIGGGTPSLLSCSQLKKLVSGVYDSVHQAEGSVEFTVEVNPENITEEFLKTAEGCGVTRLSMGIQSFDDKVLELVHRGCKRWQIEKALELTGKFWHGMFSVDIIAGLPGSSRESILTDVKKACNCGADHISLYTLTVTDNTPLAINIESGKLDFDLDEADEMWILGRDVLEENGFCQYEVSNFCRPGFESLHNSTYWKLEDYLGCGAGAAGTLYGEKIRWTNTMSIPEYQKYFQGCNEEHPDIKSFPRQIEELDFETQKFEFLMMGLRMLKGVCREEYIKRFGEDFSPEFYQVFSRWQEKGLAVVNSTENCTFYTLGKDGILFLNSFLEEIL